MKTIYFANREAARIYAREEGGQFKDQGTTAPKGKRWSVLEKELSDLVNAPVPVLTAEQQKEADELTAILNADPVQDALNNSLKFAMRKADLKAPESVVRRSVSTLTDRKGNRVEVITRRRIAV